MVVGDLGDRWDYDVLNRAFRSLMDGAELIALQKNRCWETSEGSPWTPARSSPRWSTPRAAKPRWSASPHLFFELALGELG